MSRAVAKVPPVAALIQEANGLIEEARNYGLNSVAKYVAAGEALIRAKESVQHGNWSDWLKENWDYSDRWARQLMERAKVIEIAKLNSERMEETMLLLMPPNEKTSTPSSGAKRKTSSETQPPGGEEEEADDEAIDADFEVVAEETEEETEPEASSNGKPDSEASIVRDAFDRPVPDHLRTAASAKAALISLGHKIDPIRRELDELAKKVGGEFLPRQRLSMELQAIKREIQRSAFETECPKCEGKPSKKCNRCRGAGFVPKDMINRLSDAEKGWLGI